MSERERTDEVAEQVAKPGGGAVLTGVKKWERRVFQATWTRDGQRFEAVNYSVRVAHGRQRKAVNLGTPDRREAARRASLFVATLKVRDWDEAHATLGTEPARIRAERESPTVGQYIEAAARVAIGVSAKTFRDYAANFRWLASRIGGIGHEGKTHEAWRLEVDRIKLGLLEPRSIEAAVVSYIQERGASPEARRTAASNLKQCRCIAGRKIRRLLPPELGGRNFFEGVILPEAPRPPKYVATFDHGALVTAARAELRPGDPQAWLAFILLLCGGLRRGEADGLVWANVDTAKGELRVMGTKTPDAAGTVALAPDVAAELARAKAEARGFFVLEGREVPPGGNRRTYRAEATFARLTKWLRAHGVTGRCVLHVLRKESGSVVNSEHGIHQAAAHLRHANIRITSAHYADHRGARPVVSLAIPAAAEGGK